MAQENNGKSTPSGDNDMASHYINPQDIWNLFYAIFDGNEYACAGAMGNMQAESAFYSDNAENLWNNLTGETDEWLTQNINNGNINLSTFLQRSWWVNAYGFGYGLSQWTDTTRRTKLWEFTISQGLDIDSQQGQFNYITWEWTNSNSHYNQFLPYMKSVTNVYDATKYYLKHYEVGAWTDTRYTYALHWYNTFAGSGGGDYYISLIRTGNGEATVYPTTANAGDTITLTCTPASGESLIDIIATLISTGMSMAIAVTTGSQTFPMPADNLQIEVQFSGDTPPPVPPIPKQSKRHHMPIWMYPSLRGRI